jgi:hypothetical protein
MKRSVMPKALDAAPEDTPFNHEYVIYNIEGERIKLLCRKCGETIADIVEIVTSIDPDTGIMTMGTTFRLLSNYTLIMMLLSNNKIMESAMCKTCAKRLAPDEIVKVYESEILAIERDGVIHNSEDAVAPILADLNSNEVVRRIG